MGGRCCGGVGGRGRERCWSCRLRKVVVVGGERRGRDTRGRAANGFLVMRSWRRKGREKYIVGEERREGQGHRGEREVVLCSQ